MNIYKDVAEQPDHILLRAASWLLQDRLLARGCCPNHVSMLEQTLTPATVYYAYRMDALEHTKDHSRCSEETCVADVVWLDGAPGGDAAVRCGLVEVRMYIMFFVE